MHTNFGNSFPNGFIMGARPWLRGCSRMPVFLCQPTKTCTIGPSRITLLTPQEFSGLTKVIFITLTNSLRVFWCNPWWNRFWEGPRPGVIFLEITLINSPGIIWCHRQCNYDTNSCPKNKMGKCDPRSSNGKLTISVPELLPTQSGEHQFSDLKFPEQKAMPDPRCACAALRIRSTILSSDIKTFRCIFILQTCHPDHMNIATMQRMTVDIWHLFPTRKSLDNDE